MADGTHDMGNAPGNARGAWVMARLRRRPLQGLTESATENRPPAERSTVAVAQGNLSDARMHATLGKGEKVG